MKRNLLTLTIALAAVVCPPRAHGETAVQAWARNYSNLTHSYDVGYKVVTDSSGNVIVIIQTDDGTHGTDILTIKYSGAGVPLWTNRYNGPANGNDTAFDVAVDGSGNIFVVGTSAGIGTGGDWVVLAYSSSGTPLWTNRYDGPASGDDVASAVAVDAGGNLYVTGESVGVGVGKDYTTIAYSGAGVPLWTNRYNGPGNGDDASFYIAVRGSKVFITGFTYNPSSLDDITTIAYSTSGATLWVRTYNGPANVDDEPNGMAVDISANVYVAGFSTGGPNGDDFETIAYSSGGAPLWTNLYNGPGNGDDDPFGVATDSNGNVFVTGTSYSGAATGFDIITIKYSSAGLGLWTNRYNGPANGDDEGSALTVDGSGNVIVTGNSQGTSSGEDYLTIGYANDGMTRWIARYNGPGNGFDLPESVAVDGSGNAFVTGWVAGLASQDVATIAYSSLGTTLWTNRYDGQANGDDVATAVAADSSGRVIVSGYSMSDTNDYDYATVAYSSTGVALWTNRYNGSGNGPDKVVGIVVDGSGNVVVTGTSVGANGDDYATIKYSGAGVSLWTNRYDGPISGTDDAQALAIDGSGNVAVTGYSFGSDTYDWATIKYSSTGVPLWTNRYDGGGDDQAYAVAMDGSGNVVVAGYSAGSNSDDYATVEYSSAGVPLWTNRYDGPADSDDKAQAVAVDASGNVYVTGYSTDSTTGKDYLTIKYSSAGTGLWTNRYDGPSSGEDIPTAIAVDASGNVFVTGHSFVSGSDHDYTTVAYSSSGVPLWTNTYNGPGNFTDDAVAVAVDGGGRVLVTGYSYGSGGNYEFATIAYTTGGVALWTNRYSTPFGGDSKPLTRYSMAVPSSGSVVVVGSANGSYNNEIGDYATVKYVVVPPLDISLTATNTALIYWPFPSADFGLEQNTDLNTTIWSSPPEPIGSNATIKYILASPPTGKRFFRLRLNQ